MNAPRSLYRLAGCFGYDLVGNPEDRSPVSISGSAAFHLGLHCLVRQNRSTMCCFVVFMLLLLCFFLFVFFCLFFVVVVFFFVF